MYTLTETILWISYFFHFEKLTSTDFHFRWWQMIVEGVEGGNKYGQSFLACPFSSHSEQMRLGHLGVEWFPKLWQNWHILSFSRFSLISKLETRNTLFFVLFTPMVGWIWRQSVWELESQGNKTIKVEFAFCRSPKWQSGSLAQSQRASRGLKQNRDSMKCVNLKQYLN